MLSVHSLRTNGKRVGISPSTSGPPLRSTMLAAWTLASNTRPLSVPLAHAYRLREELTTIFSTAHSKADAPERIEQWREQVACSGVTCFASFLKLLDNWQDRITNYFHSHQTSGFVEGFNNKLKVLKRRCYGMTNTIRLFHLLTLDLEGYRRFSRFA